MPQLENWMREAARRILDRYADFHEAATSVVIEQHGENAAKIIASEYEKAHAPATPATPQPVGLQVALKSLLAMCRAVYKTYAESNSEHELPGANGRTFYENIQFAGETLKELYDSVVAEAAPTTPCMHERLNEEGICRKCGEDCRGAH